MDDWNGSGWLGAATKVARGLGALGFIARESKGRAPGNHSRFLGTASLSLLLICCLILFCTGSAWSQQANLALNKQVTSHISNTVRGAPENAVDGDYHMDCNFSNVWYSFLPSEQSITIDLDAVFNVMAYRLKPLQTTHFKIETSLDNSSWVEVYSGERDYLSEKIVSLSMASHGARYVRYTGRNDRGAYVGLAEIQVYDAPAFAGGDGFEESPYQIATATQLNEVRYFLDKHFILAADIDLPAPVGGGQIQFASAPLRASRMTS